MINVDYSRGEEFILGTKNPTNALAVNGVAATLPSTSKWYPGKAAAYLPWQA
jgi:iron complex outermembrane receptor protein